MDENWWHHYDVMVVVVMELHSSWKYIVLIKLQLNCKWFALYIWWVTTLATHATCPIAFTM
jgi:hypothetical protein